MTIDASAEFRVYAYPLPWRLVAALLMVVSRGGLLAIGLGILTADAPVTLPVLVRALVVLVLLPGMSAKV